ncbi:hypothetical protein TNCV_634131 [Trichonephila clavipes]|nr:hypothetical protein TNCV_634131 [Trichonephila clavipes]
MEHSSTVYCVPQYGTFNEPRTGIYAPNLQKKTPEQQKDFTAKDTYREMHRIAGYLLICIIMSSSGRGSLVIKVMDSRSAFHEFEPSTVKDRPCRGTMHVKSVESSNAFPLVWCGS